MLFITLVLFIFQSHTSEPPALSFLTEGQVNTDKNSLNWVQLTNEETLSTFEPQESKIKTYSGRPLLPLLEGVYGDKLKQMDTISFYCQDGYRADIALNEFKSKKALMAYKMSDDSDFSLNAGSKKIPLAPFYLVWDHPSAQAATKNVYRWPYGVSQVDVINSKTAYAPLELKNSPQLQEGQKAFMRYCFSCHAINGVGGRRGPPLNTFFLTQKDEFLVKYILNPKEMNPSSQMSGLSIDLKERKKVASEIVRYGKKISR